jgi:hypothetical protein
MWRLGNSRGLSVDQINENTKAIRGSNNGTFGYGKARGGYFPPDMSGPFGYQNSPLPINLELPATFTSPGNPDNYNATNINAPSYNAKSSFSIMGYAYPNVNLNQDGFNFNLKNPSPSFADINDNYSILGINK